MAAVLCSFPLQAHADTFVTYVTGEVGVVDQIFRVVFDPEIEAAVITPLIATGRRVDGIDFLGTDELVSGAQGGAGGGAITHYSISTALELLPELVPNTGIGAPGGTSQPSSVLTTGAHVYYVENQFGFGGIGHRIMRTPIAGPPGATAVVFDGGAAGAGGLTNFEGLLIDDSRLYFFARDPGGPPMTRFLFSIGLDAAGIWDLAAPSSLVGPTPAGAPGDGADELTIDPFSRIIYGSNIVFGEIVFYDIPGAAGGLFLPPGPHPPASKLERITTMAPDGIRYTKGWLVLTGLAGVIASVDVAGVLADGADDGDIRIQYDDAVEGNGFVFDDMTPLHSVTPTPTLPGSFSLWLTLAGLGAVAGASLARRRAHARP